MTAKTGKATKGGRVPSPLARLPEERATLVQEVPPRKGTMNHSYRDYSKIQPSSDYAPVTDIDAMSFSQKVHAILSNPAYEACITWMPHGRAFKVTAPLAFEREACPKYFGHGRYSSFLRSLNNYGFKHISKGTDRNCYYHELMLRGHSHLCRFMPRCRDARRLSADPDNEPNFYCINQVVGAPESKDVVSTSTRSSSPVSSSSTTSPSPTSMSFAQCTSSTYTTSRPIMTSHAAIRIPAITQTTIQQEQQQQKQQEDGDMTLKLVLAAFLLQQLTNEAATATRY
eukprot:scaffold34922_cov141-Amphora_coffeaeformis.AAC.7